MATPFRRHRDVHLISRNGFFPWSERLQVLLFLNFPLLIILVRLSSSPPALFCCSSPCIPEKAELAVVCRGRDRNDAGLPRWLQREQCGWQMLLCGSRQAVFSWAAFPGLLTQLSLCSLLKLRAGRVGAAPLNLAEAAPGHSDSDSILLSLQLSGRLFLIFFSFLSFFFWNVFVVVGFFLKPTWQHQRFMPLLMASCSSLLLLAVPQHSRAFVCKENALLRAMPLLPAFTSGCQALQSWAFVLGCKALQSWACALGTWFKVTAKQRHLWTWL